MWLSLSPWPTPSAPKQWKSDFILRVKPLSTRDRHSRTWREKNCSECSNIKARVSVHSRTGSGPRRMAKGLQRVSTRYWILIHVLIHCDSPYPLSHEFVAIYWQKYMTRHISQPWGLNWFCVCRIVILGLLKLNFKTRQNIPEFLTANLWLINFIACSLSSSLSSEKWELRLLSYEI